MAYFRFRLASLITRHLIDQSELKIAQIKAFDVGLGSLGVIWGQNLINFKYGQISHQNDALGHEITKKLFSRSTEIT